MSELSERPKLRDFKRFRQFATDKPYDLDGYYKALYKYSEALENENVSLREKIEESHDHGLWEAEMMSNVLLSQGTSIVIDKEHFNKLYHNPEFKNRNPLALIGNIPEFVTRKEWEDLQQENQKLKEAYQLIRPYIHIPVQIKEVEEAKEYLDSHE